MQLFVRQLVSALMLSMLMVAAASAERYLGDPREAAPINKFLDSLRAQQAQLQELLGMLDHLDEWKAKLNKENERLAREGQAAKEDKRLLDSGKMTAEELNKKWHASGRSLKHDGDLKRFKADVARFNDYVNKFNQHVKSLKPLIGKRSPAEVRRLVFEMRKLDRIMRSALEAGNIEKAKYIAAHSSIASEFGYKAP